MKDVLKSSEKEKIALMVHTLIPIVSLNVSFHQYGELRHIFNNILDYDYIDSVELILDKGRNKHRYYGSKTNPNKKSYLFETRIKDPFTKLEIATLKLYYQSTYLQHLNDELLFIFFIMFVTATIMFFVFFVFFIRKDLNVLKELSSRLSNYLLSYTYKLLPYEASSKEIETIVDVVNDVIVKNSEYAKALQAFNLELESKVSEKMEALKKQEELMIHTSRQAAMGEMLESIAHQWRQPLNIIGLATTKLDLAYKFGTVDNSTFEEVIETVSYNINYMSNTIDDFRNFIHPNSEKVVFPIEKSFEELIKILGAQLKNNSIAYKLYVEKPVSVLGIENEFKQVALILINNSIDAIKSQLHKNIRKHYFISVTISNNKNSAIIDVTDNGGGIKEDIIPSIFNPYFTTKFSSQGTGIGLHIVKNIIVTRMQGSIDVNNVKDGCCFTLKLPLKTPIKDIKL